MLLIAGRTVVVVTGTQSPELPADRTRAEATLRDAEAARAVTEEQRAHLQAGLAADDVALRLQASRAVGRLEDPTWLPSITPLLDDVSIEVRAAAAWATAQAATTAAAAAAEHLGTRLEDESDNMVRAALATSLGRLPYGATEGAEAAAAALDGQLGTGNGVSSMRALGVVRGAHALARTCAARQLRCSSTEALLARLLGDFDAERTTVAPAVATRVRRLAALGLHALGRIDGARLNILIDDKDEQVRRIAALAAAADPATTSQMASALAGDAAPLVRQAFIARAGQRWPDLARRALADTDAHVRLAALDALGAARACGCDAALHAELQPGRWHEPAHALVATARSRPETVAQPLERAMASSLWQVRMYAARAAAELRDVTRLRRLARDTHPNVREAALSGLDALEHRDSDDLRRAALASSDYQLVLTAARGLKGTSDQPVARAALVAALRRLTADGRDTSRDPRQAIIERLGEVGDAATFEALEAWLDDSDPAIAASVAALRTGTAHPGSGDTAPAPMTLAVPTPAEIAVCDGTSVVLSIAGLGDVVIRLLLAEAPMNAVRFLRQVEAGAWDGLTFHRVEPGFVVQGGSPGANEYAGADRFTRDERGALSHVRGTVGISTRGRDTGDGQIFINLVDNPRLDHAYTIVGQVVAGLPHVDAMLEGAVIERARLQRR